MIMKTVRTIGYKVYYNAMATRQQTWSHMFQERFGLVYLEEKKTGPETVFKC